MRRRNIDLMAESKRLSEKLIKETRETEEFQKAFQRLNIDEIDAQKKQQNGEWEPQIRDMEIEFMNKLETRKSYMQSLEKLENDLHTLRQDNTALGIHLDSLVANIRNNQIVATSSANLEDDELRTMKLLKDNMMVKLDTKEKENELLMVKIQNQNWNYNRLKMSQRQPPHEYEAMLQDVKANSIVHRPENQVQAFMSKVSEPRDTYQRQSHAH